MNRYFRVSFAAVMLSVLAACGEEKDEKATLSTAACRESDASQCSGEAGSCTGSCQLGDDPFKCPCTCYNKYKSCMETAKCSVDDYIKQGKAKEIPGCSCKADADCDAALKEYDASGLLKARCGEQKICALSTSAAGGTTGTGKSTVGSVTISPKNASDPFELELGKTQQFTLTAKDASGNPVSATAIAWSSSKDSVVTIDQSGLATAKAEGTATIKGCAGSICDQIAILVKKAAAKLAKIEITPSPATLELECGSIRDGKQPLSYEIVDQNGKKYGKNKLALGKTVAWSSSDEKVATVDKASGTIKAVEVGKITIKACDSSPEGTPICGSADLEVKLPPISSLSIAGASPVNSNFTGSTLTVIKNASTGDHCVYNYINGVCGENELTATAKLSDGTKLGCLPCLWDAIDPSVVTFLSSSQPYGAACSVFVKVNKDFFDYGNAEPSTTVSVKVGTTFSNTVTVVGVINVEGNWKFTGYPCWDSSGVILDLDQWGRRIGDQSGWTGTGVNGSSVSYSIGSINHTGTISSSRTSMSGTCSGAVTGSWSATKQ